jgi:hypothetical protein
MTALQTRQSSDSALDGQEFFRLFQQIESSGDIFELDTSIKALCVGPQSDLADYCLSYIDKLEAPNSLNELVVSVGNPFVGRFDALLSQRIPSSNSKGRIYVATRDLYDPSYRPAAFTPPGPGADGIEFIPPRIDMIGYLSSPPAITPRRADRQYFFPFISLPAGGSVYFLLPYYGRRYAHINFVNKSQIAPGPAGNTYDLNMSGVTFSQGAILDDTNAIIPGSKAGETALGATLTVGTPAVGNRVVRATADGMFDYLQVEVSLNAGVAYPDYSTTLRVTVSDTE